MNEELTRVMAVAQSWLDGNYDAETKAQVKAMMDAEDKTELIDSFYRTLEFGPGGAGPGAGAFVRGRRRGPVLSWHVQRRIYHPGFLAHPHRRLDRPGGGRAGDGVAGGEGHSPQRVGPPGRPPGRAGRKDPAEGTGGRQDPGLYRRAGGRQGRRPGGGKCVRRRGRPGERVRKNGCAAAHPFALVKKDS